MCMFKYSKKCVLRILLLSSFLFLSLFVFSGCFGEGMEGVRQQPPLNEKERLELLKYDKRQWKKELRKAREKAFIYALRGNSEKYDYYVKREERCKRAISRVEGKISRIEKRQRGCFPKNVKVLMKDGTYKNINEIQVNDLVTVYDIGGDKLSSARVIKTLSFDNNHLHILNDGEIKATEFERFLTQNGYKRIEDIKEGDEIFNGSDYLKILSNHRENMKVKVYNLTIEGAHNFFVSNKEGKNFLVHNHGGGGGNKGGGSDK